MREPFGSATRTSSVGVAPGERRPGLSVAMALPSFPPLLGGLERQARLLSVALARRGARVRVLTGCPSPRLAGIERADGIEIHRLGVSQPRWGRRAVLGPAVVRRLIALRDAIDLVHVHGASWFSAFCVLGGRLVRKPVLVKMPNVGAWGVPGLLRRRTGPALWGILRGSDAFVALQEESEGELLGAGVPPERIVAMTNGVDTSRFRPAPPAARQDLRRRLGFPDGPVALFSGRFEPEKGLDVLLRAWATLEPGRATLVLCGDGGLRGTLEALAAELRLRAVRFAGTVDAIEEYYQASDLLVLPSHAEGNSNALLEAMACGLAPTASAVSGNEAVLGPIAAECTVPAGDVGALGRQLARLLGDIERRRALGGRCRERVRAEFSIDAVAERYLDCYRRLLATRALPRRGASLLA
jgi:glycosyltransferase involved in cell wall biosynthesis